MDKIFSVLSTMFDIKDLGSLSDFLLLLLGKIIAAVLVIFVAWICTKLTNVIIHTVMKNGKKLAGDKGRNFATFENLIKSIFKWIIYLVAIFTILTKVFEILDTSSLVTTVGVGGLAISIGAQSLISDIISGFFMMIEKQMEFGDYIEIGDIKGNVVGLELRCMKIENYEGEMVYVPYGEVRKLINKSKLESSVIVDIPVSYKQDVNSVLEIAKEVCNEYKHNDIKSQLDVLSPVSLDEKTYTVRIFGKCKSCSDWEITRDIRKMILNKANDRNIKIGFSFTD